MIIVLRLTFGGDSGPYKCDIISEMVCGLANIMVKDNDWNPLELFSLDQHLVLPPAFLDDDVEFGTERELIINVWLILEALSMSILMILLSFLWTWKSQTIFNE